MEVNNFESINEENVSLKQNQVEHRTDVEEAGSMNRPTDQSQVNRSSVIVPVVARSSQPVSSPLQP